jgi:hypothetical protein
MFGAFTFYRRKKVGLDCFFIQFFSVVGGGGWNFLVMSETALKFFSDVVDCAKKYQMAIFKPKPSKFWIF